MTEPPRPERPPGPEDPPRPDRPPRPERPPVGLCDSCRYQQEVPNTRGSVFSLCRRSRDEPERYRRYPQLPVLRCPGYEQRTTGPEAAPGS